MKKIAPKHYNLHLEPDLRTFGLRGKTEIFIETEESTDEIVLNAVDLEILDCKVDIEGGYEKADFTEPDKEAQSFTIKLPREKKGEIKVLIDYKGEINDTMVGFYRSRYTNKEGKEKYIAVTQFEEIEARKAFPCFDQPALKATFDVEYVIAKDLIGISNMPIEEEKMLTDERKRVKFEQTPVISTYLLFFGVGEFEIMEDKGDVLLRAITTPGKLDLAKEGLRFGRRCVEYFEDHFGTMYPLPKLDLIALPDFAFGAMENWGAMTFRENLLLVYPGITSRTAVKRLFEVIAHEIVHQWFGDLVSPASWRYLWLNESFATLYGYTVVDHYYPEWRTMESFLLETTAAAFSRDSLNENFPIELEEEARITASTAPIIYDKGGSILRMAIAYLGDKIRTALKDYFERHAYQTAVSSNLWEAFGRAAQDETIVEMMKSWVGQPGHPLVDVKREGNKLFLAQERLTYLNGRPHEEKWIIPLTILIINEQGEKRVIKHLLSEKKDELDLEDGIRAFKMNHEQTGFYRVKYESSEWETVGDLIKTKTISGVDRYGIQEDLFALLRRGDVKASGYLDFIERYYVDEDHPLSSRGIIKNLSHLNIVLEEEARERVRTLGKSFTERILDQIGYEPAPDEPLAVSALRSQTLWSTVLFGNPKAVDFSLGKFNRAIETGENIHPDIAEAVQKVVAYSDSHALARLISLFEKSESEQERMILSVVLGCIQKENMQKVVDFALEKIPPRLRYIPVYMMSANPVLTPYLWDMFKENQDRLEKLHPIHFEHTVIGIITVGGLFKSQEVKGFFSSYAPESLRSYQKYLRQTLDMALEVLDVNLKLRRTDSEVAGKQ